MQHPDNAEARLSNARAFDALVESGVYTAGHTHPAQFQALVAQGLDAALQVIGPRAEPLRVLELGCGAGAWLDFAQRWFTEQGVAVALHGSDLSEKMVGVCRARFPDWPAERLFVGDIMEESGYADAQFDLIFTYDVVQQLPAAMQRPAVEAIRARVTPGGAALIFDNEAWSGYGMKMALKKFATRRLGVPLVPDFFCNARYPNLSGLARGRVGAQLVTCGDLHKRALLLPVPTVV